MDNWDAVGWFACGALFGCLLAAATLNHYVTSSLRRCADTYREARELLEQVPD